jgi:hypothetical protein
LWIDRVAINQAKTTERNQQVGLMGDIYKPAFVVLVWLGPADGSTLLAFSLVHDITTQAPKLQKIKETSEYAETRAIDHLIQYLPSGDPIWLAIRSLFNRLGSQESGPFKRLFSLGR